FVGALGPGIGFVGGGKSHHDAGPYPHDGGGSSGSGENGSSSGDNGGGSSGGNGSNGGNGSSGSNGGNGNSSGNGGSSSGDAGDGGSSVGVILDITPGFFVSLDWSIIGPGGSYAGTASFGSAQSIEFVVGGIVADGGYTLTLRGTDPSGDPCRGTSAPFSVAAGGTSSVSVIIQCFTGDGAAQPAMIMTGNVAVDAGVVQH
ncbi:MAG: hypothetical protein ACRENE_24155, partial [Polyangiaceae bacterium]